MVTRPETHPAAAALDPSLAARFEHTPWGGNALLWLKRFIMLRFAALLPLIAIGLVFALKGRIAEPGALFGVILTAAVSNVFVMLVARRIDLNQLRAAAVVLWISLALDVLFLVATAALVVEVRAAAAAFTVVPLLLAAFACGEAPTLRLAGVATATLVAGAIFEDGRLLPRWAIAGSACALGWIVVAGALWYRRRGRFLEERLRELEFRRALEEEAAAVRAAIVPETRPDRSLVEVAHALAEDLREPTGVVRARSERLRFELRYKQNGDRTLVPDLDRVLHAADRLDDVRLTLAALAGEDAGETRKCDIGQVFRELRLRLKPAFERDGVQLRFEGSRLVRPVAASHNEVRLVLVRLLETAHKAALGAAKNARVSIRATGVADGVQLSVRDMLPAPKLDAPADAFHPDYSPKERPALGLALVVAKALVERRHGSVDLELPPRGGIAVRITLPVAPSSNGLFATSDAPVEGESEPAADEARVP